MWSQWPATGEFAIGLLLGIRLIFSGWSIAMLGMMGDATVDVVEHAGREALREEFKQSLKEGGEKPAGEGTSGSQPSA
jgi:hypothetical protein